MFPLALNYIFIILISRKTNLEFVPDYRLISLCNVLYKIIVKVLAERLKDILSHIISSTYSAFMPGHLISNNILIIYEMMNHLSKKRKRKMEFMSLKLDVNRSYDRVEWKFLETMLKELGFNDLWIEKIMNFVWSITLSFLKMVSHRAS